MMVNAGNPGLRRLIDVSSQSRATVLRGFGLASLATTNGVVEDEDPSRTRNGLQQPEQQSEP